MGLVRELIRQEKRNIGLVVLVGGIAVDWLSAAGVLDRLIGAAVSMEQFGLCQQYRKAVESGQIRVEELSETALNARLGAGARNLPFLPTRGLIGTDLIDINRQPRCWSTIRSAARRSSPAGRSSPTSPSSTSTGPTAPATSSTSRRRIWPDLGIIPEGGQAGDRQRRGDRRHRGAAAQPRPHACCPASSSTPSSRQPFGAHPTSCNPQVRLRHRLPPRLGQGGAGRGRGGRSSSQRYVHRPADQVAYLDAVGGAERLLSIDAVGARDVSATTDDADRRRLDDRRAARHHAGRRVRQRRPGVQRDGVVHPGLRLHARQADPRPRPRVAGRRARPRAAARRRCRRPHWRRRCGATR